MIALYKKLYQYGQEPSTHDLVKFLAMLLMFVDHSGLYLLNDNVWCRIMGRLAAPLFFFLVGYANSHKFKIDILYYGIALSFISCFIDGHIYLNILLNFVLIKLILDQYAINKLSSPALIILFAVLFISYLFTSGWLEYGSLGLMFAIGGRLSATKDKRMIYWLLLTIISYFIFESLGFNFISSMHYEILFIVICLFMMFTMFFYQPRQWHLQRLLTYPILFVSRYSLELYFLHVAVLKFYIFFK